MEIGLCFWGMHLVRNAYLFFYKRTMPYNKKLTDLNRSDSTGKYPSSVLLYWPRYRSVNTTSPLLHIFPYCPHSRSVSWNIFLKHEISYCHVLKILFKVVNIDIQRCCKYLNNCHCDCFPLRLPSLSIWKLVTENGSKIYKALERNAVCKVKYIIF
jgi:hypothetical protein